MPVLQDTRLSRSSYPQQQTPRTVSPSTIGTTFVTQQTRGKNSTHTHISPTSPFSQKYHLKLLQHDPTTAEIFEQPLLISYKRDKNLSNFLVKSTLKSDHQPGTFKYARVRCRTCPFISNANNNLSELSVTISDHLTCIFLIYCIICTICKIIYIGETGSRWLIVSANTLGMLRSPIKTLLNQSHDISTSPTILKNTWRFVAFTPSS